MSALILLLCPESLAAISEPLKVHDLVYVVKDVFCTLTHLHHLDLLQERGLHQR